MSDLNEKLLEIQQQLSNPEGNSLDYTADLIAWSSGRPIRREFLLNLINKLKWEQIIHFPQLLVLGASIEEGKDYSNEPLLPFIKENFKKEEIELAEFVLEEKQGSLSDWGYDRLLKIKRNIPLWKGEDFEIDIEFGGFELDLLEWIDGFSSTENMELCYFSDLHFNAITKEQFLATFPGKKPENISRQSWVYELSPEILEKRMNLINDRMIILPSSIAKKYKDYTPPIAYPFVRKELFGIPKPGWYEPLSECLDSLANSQPVDVESLFKEGEKEEVIDKLIREYGQLQNLLRFMPKLFPSLSDFIVSLHPFLNKKQEKKLMKYIPFLYLVLYKKGLVPEPKPVYEEEVLYGDHKGRNTMIFRPKDYKFTGEEWTEELKDPCYLFGFGYTVRDDDLEHFIECAEGKENEEYEYFGLPVTLKDMAASLGAERIWNWLGLNGFPEETSNEEGMVNNFELHAFGGRNQEIIKDVLKNTEKSPVGLLGDASEVYNYDVFSYLVELHEVERLWFGGVPSPRFIQMIKYPEFWNKDYMTWWYAEQGIEF